MANAHRESNTKELPLSMDSVRKKIIRVVNKVENEVKEFLTTYSGYPEPNKNWETTTEKACNQVDKTAHDLHSFDDLEMILVKVRVNQAMPLSEYNELRRMLESKKLFDYITHQLCSDLVHTYENQVEKFCISFHQETERQDLESVNEYEMVIANCHQQIVENMIKVEDALEEVEEIRRKSVMNYIKNYGKVLENMEAVCHALEEVCRLIRKRVAADSDYPQNIQEEINCYNRQLLDLKKLNRELEEEQNGDGRRLRRTTGNLAKTEKQLKSVRAEVGLFRQRQRNVEDNRSTLEATLRQKLKERQQVKDKLKNKDNATSVNSRLSAQSEELQTQIHTIEMKMRQMEVQLESLRTEEEKVVQVMEKLSEQVESSRRKCDDANDQAKSHEETLKAINEDVELHESKIEALKIIRKVKMHTDTLKKIHHNEYDPEHALEIKGTSYL